MRQRTPGDRRRSKLTTLRSKKKAAQAPPIELGQYLEVSPNINSQFAGITPGSQARNSTLTIE
ncbi:hypothetical protein CHELA1G11_13845 [Hyphomicrobiales bacterium]|nr:hypothetical protein CHELA1G2_10470 [Hyphomicrobiales bacterium]CAH1674439.1 hypothetical protein CHELA1G11_13845 [Hyphomicrobiales bacterium]